LSIAPEYPHDDCEQEEERARAERLAGITETTIAVAHEMNNVLTVPMMNAELLASDARSEKMIDLSPKPARKPSKRGK
jgi:hypothetical protein